MTDLKVLERIQRNNHHLASKWFDWEHVVKHINKVKSIAEVNGGGESIIAAMVLNHNIRIGVLLVTEITELDATFKNCIVSLASINCDDFPFNIVYKNDVIIIKFGYSRKLKIIYGAKKIKGALGGSDLIICQFPTQEQLLELRGNSHIICHQIEEIDKGFQELHFDKIDQSYHVFYKPVNNKKSIHWGTNDVRIIGPRTGREHELCSRFS
jgi:hypothetical protein